jgi:Asp/Glu/hydantoin racemase
VAAPAIGILMLETGFPRITGDIGNPESFEYPVRYKVVKGASPHRVVRLADPALINPFAQAAQELEAKGVKAITTSCGFLAIFQKELSAAVSVPFFSSSLMQVHMARAIIKPGQKVGILTARRASLTPRHLAGVGLEKSGLAIGGLEDAPEFASVFLEGKTSLDEAKCRQEVCRALQDLLGHNPEVGAIVLECTNLPPYSAELRKISGLPVFDAITLVNYIHHSLGSY